MKVSVIGCGVFALANAKILVDNNVKISIWAESDNSIKKITSKKYQEDNFKKEIINDKFEFTTSMEECLKDTDLIFILVTVKYIESVCLEIKKYYKKNIPILIGSKGIDNNYYIFADEVVKKNINTNNISVLSGPSFAIDIINNNPIGYTLAANNKESIKLIKKVLQSDKVKIRETNDIVGVEMLGSIKNVIAIASGIVKGLGFSESTQCFLITEAMHDIKELLKNINGNKKTVNSYAGIGDLILTCTSTKSRNYTYGYILGTKDYKKAQEYLESTTVEGYYTSQSLYNFLKKKNIKMPVISMIYHIINQEKEPDALIEFLNSKK